MIKPNPPWPNRLTLSGADYFLLQLDHLLWRSCRQRNVCIFVVSLQQPLTHAELVRHVANQPAYQWLCRLRLRRGLPFSLAKWVLVADAELPVIKQHRLRVDENFPEQLLQPAMDIHNESGFSIDFCQRDGTGPLLVFTWHHALMDAHGGEILIRRLGQRDAGAYSAWIADTPITLPFRERARIARAMKQFLYNAAQQPLLSLYRKSSAKPSPQYRFLTFTKAQSRLIQQQAREYGAGFLVSAFLLAATACAVGQLHRQRGLPLEDIVVPVPLDKRKRGGQSPVFGNQVSFLFYRIPKTALTDLSVCTNELIEQMKALMRADNPKHYVVMMDFLRRVPGFFYRRMLKAPTKGVMASFYYSDTGESLQDFTDWLGRPVNDARHYPPNSYPPGMTFIFSRFQNSLRLTFGYMQPVISDAEAEQLLHWLSASLLPADDAV